MNCCHHFKGTRFRPLSLDLPKPLFPIAGRPIIQHHIEACVQLKQLKEILIIGYYPAAQMEKFVTDMQTVYNVSIRFVCFCCLLVVHVQWVEKNSDKERNWQNSQVFARVYSTWHSGRHVSFSRSNSCRKSIGIFRIKRWRLFGFSTQRTLWISSIEKWTSRSEWLQWKCVFLWVFVWKTYIDFQKQ